MKIVSAKYRKITGRYIELIRTEDEFGNERFYLMTGANAADIETAMIKAITGEKIDWEIKDEKLKALCSKWWKEEVSE